MSSTPLSGNAIRGPNGAHSPSNKTNPQLLDTSWAASLAGDQHTIVFWLILFVYMKTQRIVSPHCAAKPDTLWYIIECWLRILFLNDKLCSEARSGLGCLVKYFFTSVFFFFSFYAQYSFSQTQHLLYVFITPHPNASLVKYYSGLVVTLLKNFPSSTSPLSSFPFPHPPFPHPPRGWGSLERGRFHHLVLPGSIPALACPLRDLFCASTDDDPGSTPPLPTEHINHLHSSQFWGREGGEGDFVRWCWWSLWLHFTHMMRREKGNKGGDGGVGAAAFTSALVMSACTRRMPGKEPQGAFYDTSQGRWWGRRVVGFCMSVVDFICHVISLKSEQTPEAWNRCLSLQRTPTTAHTHNCSKRLDPPPHPTPGQKKTKTKKNDWMWACLHLS